VDRTANETNRFGEWMKRRTPGRSIEDPTGTEAGKIKRGCDARGIRYLRRWRTARRGLRAGRRRLEASCTHRPRVMCY
jgi:hypothetical protein